MPKVVTVFLALLVVVLLAGASQAQLFIEDFDTYSDWAEGPGTKLTSKSPTEKTNGWMKGVIGNLRRQHGLINTDGINETQAGGGHSIDGAGDATGDGKVDGDDFLVWQNSFSYSELLTYNLKPNSRVFPVGGGLFAAEVSWY